MLAMATQPHLPHMLGPFLLGQNQAMPHTMDLGTAWEQGVSFWRSLGLAVFLEGLLCASDLKLGLHSQKG